MIEMWGQGVHRCSRYQAGGWLHWPDHEVESAQLSRLLGDAQEGASFVSECFSTADKIIPGDDESWLREWQQLADRIAACARLSCKSGNLMTARSEWLRALNYYRTATIFLSSADPRSSELSRIAEACARFFLSLLRPFGEIVEIRASSGVLPGYFVRPPDAPQKSPVIIAVGEARDTKEDLLVRFQAHSIARGFSLLVVDLPACSSSQQSDRSVYYHQNNALRCCLDYLLSREDVDSTRIALWGDGLGGILATRVAATDSRLAAAVCDGGLWDDLEEQYAEANFAGGSGLGQGIPGPRYQLAKKIKCACLIVTGEHGYVKLDDVIALQNHCKAAGVPIDLKIFWGDGTGSSHRQLDNPTIGRQFVFDWMEVRLRLNEFVRPSVSHLGNWEESESQVATSIV